MDYPNQPSECEGEGYDPEIELEEIILYEVSSKIGPPGANTSQFQGILKSICLKVCLWHKKVCWLTFCVSLTSPIRRSAMLESESYPDILAEHGINSALRLAISTS